MTSTPNTRMFMYFVPIGKTRNNMSQIFTKRAGFRIIKLVLSRHLFIEAPVPSQESERSYICVLWVFNLPLYTILIFDSGIVLTVWYCLLFIWSLWDLCFRFQNSTDQETKSSYHQHCDAKSCLISNCFFPRIRLFSTFEISKMCYSVNIFDQVRIY